jgi:hypothetical protein
LGPGHNRQDTVKRLTHTAATAFLLFATLAACGSSSSDADAQEPQDSEGDLGQPTALADAVSEEVKAPTTTGCLGASTSEAWKVQYGDFCKSVITPENVAAGETCILLTQNPTEDTCYCAECGLRGEDYLCFKEVCD